MNHPKRNPEQRAEVLKLLASGIDPKDVAKDKKIPLTTILYWRKVGAKASFKPDIRAVEAENIKLRKLLAESLVNEALAKAA